MPNDPINDPLLRSPRSFVPSLPAMADGPVRDLYLSL